MNSLNSRVAYLKGLMEGMEIDKSTKEGKVLSEMADILKDIATEIEYVKDSQEDMEEYMSALDEDLEDVENEIYGEDDDEEDEDDYVEVKCPSCGEVVYVENDILDEEKKIECPNCGKSIELNESCTCNNCCD